MQSTLCCVVWVCVCVCVSLCVCVCVCLCVSVCAAVLLPKCIWSSPSCIWSSCRLEAAWNLTDGPAPRAFLKSCDWPPASLPMLVCKAYCSVLIAKHTHGQEHAPFASTGWASREQVPSFFCIASWPQRCAIMAVNHYGSESSRPRAALHAPICSPSLPASARR